MSAVSRLLLENGVRFLEGNKWKEEAGPGHTHTHFPGSAFIAHGAKDIQTRGRESV